MNEKINLQQYAEDAEKTESKDFEAIAKRLSDTETIRLLHCCMGIVTEAGELMDALKKHIFYGKPLDFVNVKEEMGDLFWYIRILLQLKATSINLQEVLDTNIAKLKARYPNKFTEHDAINRNLEAERKILEQEIGNV